MDAAERDPFHADRSPVAAISDRRAFALPQSKTKPANRITFELRYLIVVLDLISRCIRPAPPHSNRRVNRLGSGDRRLHLRLAPPPKNRTDDRFR